VRHEGKPYYVDGVQVVPPGSAIRLERDVRVVGVNEASLDVQGGFEAHGTQDHWVRIEDVDFSRTRRPETNFHFDMVDLVACSFVHADGQSFDGQMTVENSCLQGSCKFAVRLAGGFLRVMTTEFVPPCRVDVLPTKGKPPELAFRSSWMKRVEISGPAAATVRASELKLGLVARDFTDLVVDGCDLWGSLELRQKEGGSFSRLVLTKCNLFGGATLVLDRPAGEKKSVEKVRVERFFFGDASDSPVLEDDGVADRIRDGADDPKASVKAFWSKPSERRHVFVSHALRVRAPPAR
jgi:hypothetical protein